MSQDNLNAKVFKMLYLGRKPKDVRKQLEAELINKYQIELAFSFCENNNIIQSLRLV